jgi:hypothetical protein
MPATTPEGAPASLLVVAWEFVQLSSVPPLELLEELLLEPPDELLLLDELEPLEELPPLEELLPLDPPEELPLVDPPDELELPEEPLLLDPPDELEPCEELSFMDPVELSPVPPSPGALLEPLDPQAGSAKGTPARANTRSGPMKRTGVW